MGTLDNVRVTMFHPGRRRLDSLDASDHVGTLYGLSEATLEQVLRNGIGIGSASSDLLHELSNLFDCWYSLTIHSYLLGA